MTEPTQPADRASMLTFEKATGMSMFDNALKIAIFHLASNFSRATGGGGGYDVNAVSAREMLDTAVYADGRPMKTDIVDFLLNRLMDASERLGLGYAFEESEANARVNERALRGEQGGKP